nr:mucin-2-like [Rhipicephalus microplus]
MFYAARCHFRSQWHQGTADDACCPAGCFPVEVRHLVAESSSRPRPFDGLCAAVLACYGETYCPLTGSRELQVSPPPQRAVPSGPQPSIDHYLDIKATTTSTSDPVAGTSNPAPDHDQEVEDAPTATDPPSEKCIPSEPAYAATSHLPAICTSSAISTARDTMDPPDFTTATLPHTSESSADNLAPAVHLSVAEPSVSLMSEGDSLPTPTLCVSCQQRPAWPSQFAAAEVEANSHQAWPNFRDAATMTDAPKDDMPGPPMTQQTAPCVPLTQADNHQAASTNTGTPADLLIEPPPTWSHDRPPVSLKGDTTSQQSTLNSDVPLATARASSMAVAHRPTSRCGPACLP